jgi:hypothetical protein
MRRWRSLSTGDKIAIISVLVAVFAALPTWLALRPSGQGEPPTTTLGSAPTTVASPTTAFDATDTSAAANPAASDKSTVYLADLPMVDELDSNAYAQAGSIGGKEYPHSVTLDPTNPTYKSSASFDLGGHYTRLKASVGLLSTSPEGYRLSYEFYGNGQSIKKGMLTLFRAVPIDLDVRGVQRLKFAVSLPAGADYAAASGVQAVLGDPTLTVDSTNPPPDVPPTS